MCWFIVWPFLIIYCFLFRCILPCSMKMLTRGMSTLYISELLKCSALFGVCILQFCICLYYQGTASKVAQWWNLCYRLCDEERFWEHCGCCDLAMEGWPWNLASIYTYWQQNYRGQCTVDWCELHCVHACVCLCWEGWLWNLTSMHTCIGFNNTSAQSWLYSAWKQRW